MGLVGRSSTIQQQFVKQLSNKNRAPGTFAKLSNSATSPGAATAVCPSKRDRIFPGSADLYPQCLVNWRKDKPEPQVVVAVTRRVVVSVRRARVPGVVVPAAAANHAVRALGQNPISFYNMLFECLRGCCIGKPEHWFYMAD